MVDRTKRTSGKEILESIYEGGLDAVNAFEQRYGKVQNTHLVKSFTPPVSCLWVGRAAWGELASKYVFWAEYMHSNKFLYSATELHHAMRYLDLQDQSHKSWHITGQQILQGQLENVTTKHIRYTTELVDLMEWYTRETKKV